MLFEVLFDGKVRASTSYLECIPTKNTLPDMEHMGRLTDHNASCFLKANLKLLVCGVSAWEIDTLTDFLRGNKYANTIKYLLWPANEVQTKSYIKNLRHGECHGYTVSYNPDPLIKNADNTKMFQKLLQPLVNTI